MPKPPVSNPTRCQMPLAQAAAAGVLAAIGLPGWLLLVLVGLSLVPMLLLIRHAVRSNVICTRQAALVAGALEKYQPVFAVYYGSSVGATYQLGMWLPYLDRLNLRYVVISRVAHNLPEIARLTSAPIVVPKSAGEVGTLPDMVTSSLKAAFYVQGSSTNLQFQRFQQITHVWLNHGDSDKRANFSAAHATFDKVFVAGQQGVERYAKHGVRMSRSQMVVVGRPQIERIKPREAALPPGAPRTVLYAPTWQGGKPTTNYSSLALGAKIVSALLERPATVIFRPHPFTYRDPRQTRLAREIQTAAQAGSRAHRPRARLGQAGREDLGHPRLLQPHGRADHRRLLGRLGLPGHRQAAGHGGDPAERRGLPRRDPDGPGRLRDREGPVHVGRRRSTPCSATIPWQRSAGRTGSTAWVSGSASMPLTDSSRPPGASSRAVAPSRRRGPAGAPSLFYKRALSLSTNGRRHPQTAGLVP